MGRPGAREAPLLFTEPFDPEDTSNFPSWARLGALSICERLPRARGCAQPVRSPTDSATEQMGIARTHAQTNGLLGPWEQWDPPVGGDGFACGRGLH